MFKDTPKGLLDAVSRIASESAAKYAAEQAAQQAKYTDKKLKTLPQGKADDPVVKGAEKVVEAKSHTVPSTPKEKKLAAMAEPKDKITHADVMKARGVSEGLSLEELEKLEAIAVKEGWDDMVAAVKKKSEAEKQKKMTKTGHEVKKTDTGTQYTKTYNKKTQLNNEEVEQIDELSKDTLKKYADKAKAVSKNAKAYGSFNADPDDSDLADKNWKKHEKLEKGIKKAKEKMSEDVDQIDEISMETKSSYGKKAMKQYSDMWLAKKRENDPAKAAELKKKMDKRGSGIKRLMGENDDTPGNSAHQCAIHVKSEQFGEGKTLFSQHAEPDALGNIAWYDVMFAEGIQRVDTNDIEILVSESHMSHKKKKKM
jgi:hypothetical protein